MVLPLPPRRPAGGRVVLRFVLPFSVSLPVASEKVEGDRRGGLRRFLLLLFFLLFIAAELILVGVCRPLAGGCKGEPPFHC